MEILSVKVNNIQKSEILNQIRQFLNSDTSHKIFTPNPEMLVDADKDQYFKEILNSGDLNVCDGFGLSLVSGIKRYPGVELMSDICALAENENRSVYLLGSGSDEVLKKTVEELNKKYPNLKIVGYNKGPAIGLQTIDHRLQINKIENEEILNDIIMSAPDILFVAFGHVKQEKWIYENLKHLPSVKVAMGVGGAFDFISKKTKRAPLFMRKIGLEWLYRLIKQPWRIKRIWKATAIFLFLYVRQKR